LLARNVGLVLWCGVKSRARSKNLQTSCMSKTSGSTSSIGSGSKAIYMLDEFGAVATPFLQPKRGRAKKRVA